MLNSLTKAAASLCADVISRQTGTVEKLHVWISFTVMVAVTVQYITVSHTHTHMYRNSVTVLSYV